MTGPTATFSQGTDWQGQTYTYVGYFTFTCTMQYLSNGEPHDTNARYDIVLIARKPEGDTIIKRTTVGNTVTQVAFHSHDTNDVITKEHLGSYVSAIVNLCLFIVTSIMIMR